jgi:4-phospho-D-threonate 3-dehydrogenase / 4-phospho-D-erythronate 3-dehydrogenase
LWKTPTVETNVKPVIGISMGDPAGIGPEICAKALSQIVLYDRCRPLVVGDAAVMREAIRQLELP